MILILISRNAYADHFTSIHTISLPIVLGSQRQFESGPLAIAGYQVVPITYHNNDANNPMVNILQRNGKTEKTEKTAVISTASRFLSNPILPHVSFRHAAN